MAHLFEVTFSVYTDGGNTIPAGLQNVTTQIMADYAGQAQAMVEAQYGGYDRNVIVNSVWQRS